VQLTGRDGRCIVAKKMAKTVEIQLADDVLEALERRAREEKVSLGDLIAREMGPAEAKLTLPEVIDRILAQPRIRLPLSSAEIIRELRGPLPIDDDTHR
jgi:hypothetical protein